MDALDAFYPKRMADRILGMGDIVSLVEKAQEQYDQEAARKLQKKIAKNQFDFTDFMSQIQQIKKMGNIKDLAGMIPGMGKAMKNLDMDDDAFKGIEAIINSMTPDERLNPMLLNGRKRKRIAKDGKGTRKIFWRLVRYWTFQVSTHSPAMSFRLHSAVGARRMTAGSNRTSWAMVTVFSRPLLRVTRVIRRTTEHRCRHPM